MDFQTLINAFQSHPAASVIAVGSGKGGVGKSTISVNLALGLQALGAQVGLFDADIYGPNIPLLLGIHRRRPSKQWEGKSWAPVWRPEAAARYIRPLERFGLRLMSLGLLVWGVVHEALVSAVRLDGIVLVTTPQALALLDSARSLKLYQQSELPILGVVENMSYFECPTCGERHELFGRDPERWTELFGDLPLLQRIPLIPAAAQRLTPAYLESFQNEAAHGAGAIFVQLARNVAAAIHG
jgi:ATP-binding protein involved in chromosome partitioning